MLNLQDFLDDFKNYLQDILISGVSHISASNIKKLREYLQHAEKLNLLSLKELIHDFLNSTTRIKELINLFLWVDMALVQYQIIKMEINL